MNIYEEFKLTNWYINFNKSDKDKFDDFFFNVFLAKMKHPENPKRTFIMVIV